MGLREYYLNIAKLTSFSMNEEPTFTMRLDQNYEVIRLFQYDGKKLLLGHCSNGQCFVSEYKEDLGLISYTFKLGNDNWGGYFPFVKIFRHRFNHDTDEGLYLFACSSTNSTWSLRKYNPEQHIFNIPRGAGFFPENIVSADIFHDSGELYFAGIGKNKKIYIYKFFEFGSAMFPINTGIDFNLINCKEVCQTQWHNLYLTTDVFSYAEKTYLFAQSNSRWFLSQYINSHFNYELSDGHWNYLYTFTKVFPYRLVNNEEILLLFGHAPSSGRWFVAEFKNNSFNEEFYSGHLPSGLEVRDIFVADNKDFSLFAMGKNNTFYIYDMYIHSDFRS